MSSRRRTYGESSDGKFLMLAYSNDLRKGILCSGSDGINFHSIANNLPVRSNTSGNKFILSPNKDVYLISPKDNYENSECKFNTYIVNNNKLELISSDFPNGSNKLRNNEYINCIDKTAYNNTVGWSHHSGLFVKFFADESGLQVREYCSSNSRYDVSESVNSISYNDFNGDVIKANSYNNGILLTLRSSPDSNDESYYIKRSYSSRYISYVDMLGQDYVWYASNGTSFNRGYNDYSYSERTSVDMNKTFSLSGVIVGSYKDDIFSNYLDDNRVYHIYRNKFSGDYFRPINNEERIEVPYSYEFYNPGNESSYPRITSIEDEELIYYSPNDSRNYVTLVSSDGGQSFSNLLSIDGEVTFNGSVYSVICTE